MADSINACEVRALNVQGILILIVVPVAAERKWVFGTRNFDDSFT